MSKELNISTTASFCANAMICFFTKRGSSSYIINRLVRNIPTLSHYSWTKKSMQAKKKHKHKESDLQTKKKKKKKNFFFKNFFF